MRLEDIARTIDKDDIQRLVSRATDFYHIEQRWQVKIWDYPPVAAFPVVYWESPSLEGYEPLTDNSDYWILDTQGNWHRETEMDPPLADLIYMAAQELGWSQANLAEVQRA